MLKKAAADRRRDKMSMVVEIFTHYLLQDNRNIYIYMSMYFFILESRQKIVGNISYHMQAVGQ